MRHAGLTLLLAAAVGIPAGAAHAAMTSSTYIAGAFLQAFTGADAMTDASGGGSLVPQTTPATPTQSNLAPSDAAGKLCAEGARAIDQGRWSDAVDLFSKVIALHGDHADGALYWKAYAENKLGQSKASQQACAALRADYPKSRWIDDCGALEVETRARSGKKVEIDPNASDDVKLLALNTMLRQNEGLALAQIQEILKGDSSEKLKREAQFILGNHYSDVTYAQIVRIRTVEGDVRIQRGEPNAKAGNALWEKAAADLPIETGFSLVTGPGGRAEIEFENASTIYLGENSVLTFNDLHATAGIPFTELGLLSGTVSLYFQPYIAGEKLVLHTPSNDFVSRFPDKSFARIEAFTDAVSITPLPGSNLRLPLANKETLQPGRTWTYRQGQLLDAEGMPTTPEFTAWDRWVDERVTERRAATASVLQASGLTAPIPGMAEMAGQGKFFDCAPYGTCWEPKDETEADQAQGQQSSYRQPARNAGATAHMVTAAYYPSFVGNGGFARQAQAARANPNTATPDAPVYDFPCTPESLIFRTTKDPATGKIVRVATTITQHNHPYDWAVCHAGSWIRHKKHYAWVASGKRHHIPPVRWVKSGKTVGFVPLHPYDVKGQPAINARHEVFAVIGKGQVNGPVRVEPVRFESNMRIDYLKEVPKEYAVGALRPLAAAEAPHMEAHAFGAPHGVSVAEAHADGRQAGIPMRFDVKSASFMIAKEQVSGGHTATVFAPMSNRTGSLQARSESFTGGSSARAGSIGGFRSSGGSSSGGSHASSGGGGGGGASHGGGGGGGSSAASSSATSSSASSGGAHH